MGIKIIIIIIILPFLFRIGGLSATNSNSDKKLINSKNLMQALKHYNFDNAKNIIRKNINVDYKNLYEESLLTVAVYRGSKKIVLPLIKK